MLVRTSTTRTATTGTPRCSARPAATPAMTLPCRWRTSGGRGVVRHVGLLGPAPFSYAVCTVPSSPTRVRGGDHHDRVWGSHQGAVRVDPHGRSAPAGPVLVS